MVRFISSAFALLALQQSVMGFSNHMETTKSSNSALFSFKAMNYAEPDWIVMEQNGGVVPSKPRTPIKTQPSAMSKISIEMASDDQHDANYHKVKTVPSAMSAIERGSASDDQHDANFKTIRTVPSTMSAIDRGSATDDQHDANFKVVKTVPSAMSAIDRAPATDDQHDAHYHSVKTVPSSISNAHPTRHGLGAGSRVTSATVDFAKKSCTQGRTDTDPYYE